MCFFSCFFSLVFVFVTSFFLFFYLLLQMELHLESKVFLIIAEHYTRTELIFIQFDAHFFTCFYVFYNFAFKCLELKKGNRRFNVYPAILQIDHP